MKTILSVIIIVVLSVSIVRAQGSLATKSAFQIQKNVTSDYSLNKFQLEDYGLYGLMFDEGDGWGFGAIISSLMLEYMTQDGADHFGRSGKLGWTFGLFSGESVNFNLYGMGGYGYYEAKATEQIYQGLILEPGALIGIKLGNSYGIGFGMGYVIDNALEKEYLVYKFYVILD